MSTDTQPTTGDATSPPAGEQGEQGEQSDAAAEAHRLTPQQLAYFTTFGYLRIPGLFAEDIDAIAAGFDEVMATNETWDSNEWLHFEQKRSIVPRFIDRHPTLDALRSDPRILGVVTSIIGPTYEYAESDGSLFFCDTSWHPDFYGAPIDQFHLKLSFYLDPLTAATGAIRMIPGTNHHPSPYARTLYRTLQKPDEIRDAFGVDYDQIPSVAVESKPGDLLLWNYRTIHASFGGSDGRRLFSVSFRQPRDEQGTGDQKAAKRRQRRAQPTSTDA
ncbi:MAG: phytanoyl-CoA dioxygenase family protein [Acidimicrobiia bacterium]|nr:phytanoyl-CoA dioxygenase family protein [Acidimicrobiia bacterium]